MKRIYIVIKGNLKVKLKVLTKRELNKIRNPAYKYILP